jgi:hypothetical protein
MGENTVHHDQSTSPINLNTTSPEVNRNSSLTMSVKILAFFIFYLFGMYQ